MNALITNEVKLRKPSFPEADLLGLFQSTSFESLLNWPPVIADTSDFAPAPPQGELILAYKVCGRTWPWPRTQSEEPTTIQLVLGEREAALALSKKTGLCGPGDINDAPGIYAILSFQLSEELLNLPLIAIGEKHRKRGNMTVILVNLLAHSATHNIRLFQLVPCHPSTKNLVGDNAKIIGYGPAGNRVELETTTMRQRLALRQSQTKKASYARLISKVNCTLWLVRNGFSLTEDNVNATIEDFAEGDTQSSSLSL